MVTALKHTSVTNIFTTQEFKTFFCWSEAWSDLSDSHDESTVLLSHNNSFASEADIVIGDVYFTLFALRSL